MKKQFFLFFSNTYSVITKCNNCAITIITKCNNCAITIITKCNNCAITIITKLLQIVIIGGIIR